MKYAIALVLTGCATGGVQFVDSPDAPVVLSERIISMPGPDSPSQAVGDYFSRPATKAVTAHNRSGQYLKIAVHCHHSFPSHIEIAIPPYAVRVATFETSAMKMYDTLCVLE